MDFKNMLDGLRREGNYRSLPPEKASGVLDFTSNDYMGIAASGDLTREFLNSISEYLFTSSASRLLASRQHDYANLEILLKTAYGREALIFNSGYHVNTGVIPAIASDTRTLIIADKLVHASMIDGIILSRADFKRYPHNDMEALRKLVDRNVANYDRVMILTESVFSMDGDTPDVEAILNIKREFPNVVLYLDEAHAFGVKGAHGLGLARSSSAPEMWDIVVCPLGKAAASMGAFVICSESVKDFLINRARTLIFSTALPPIQVKWTEFVIGKLMGMDEARARLEELSLLFSEMLSRYFPENGGSSSHIQPLVVGDAAKALAFSRRFAEEGVKVLPIRKPTVPPGTERLRFSLSASMVHKDLERVENVLKTF